MVEVDMGSHKKIGSCGTFPLSCPLHVIVQYFRLMCVHRDDS